MNSFFRLLFKLLALKHVASGEFTLVGSLIMPLHVKTGFKPKDIEISLGQSVGHPTCVHDEDWFSWSVTEDGFLFRAKLVSEHRKIFWSASR